MYAGENLVPKQTDVDQESRDQQDEIKVKSLLQLQKDENEKQERIDNMFMNLRSAETVRYIIGRWFCTCGTCSYLALTIGRCLFHD